MNQIRLLSIQFRLIRTGVDIWNAYDLILLQGRILYPPIPLIVHTMVPSRLLALQSSRGFD